MKPCDRGKDGSGRMTFGAAIFQSYRDTCLGVTDGLNFLLPSQSSEDDASVSGIPYRRANVEA